ncbi:RNA polymerase sigma factor [Aurantibacillus circumpalustris]|uniref:RNA polymerase sigma factor n=1 Tax=Aurantibacillus circumpalustris TaxID=3036359 RepID=UPI00295AD4E7|nr:RNA polymerase sigma factor [Aurantibacillus circumpalustris]
MLEQCKKNDRQAQFQLYNHLAPALLGLTVRYMQDKDEAEDVMQDSFVKIFLNLKSFKNEGSFEGWAKRITVNTALTALKNKKRIYFERNLEIVETIELEQDEQDLLQIPEILSCMKSLPEGYRTIINLALIEEFSHKEIAEKLGITESTSRSQLARARQSLMKMLKEKTLVSTKKNA